MATLQSGKCFTVPTFFGMCCRSEWQERMYIYKWHEVDQTKHEIFCVHIVCNEIQVKVNLEITTFFFYLHFPYCPNFFWFGVVQKNINVTFWLQVSSIHFSCSHVKWHAVLTWNYSYCFQGPKNTESPQSWYIPQVHKLCEVPVDKVEKKLIICLFCLLF